jgi:transposase
VRYRWFQNRLYLSFLCTVMFEATYHRGSSVVEKTDRIDAEVIAKFGGAKPFVPTPPKSEDQQKMVTRVAKLRQITSDTTIQKQRLSSAHDSFMRTTYLKSSPVSLP